VYAEKREDNSRTVYYLLSDGCDRMLGSGGLAVSEIAAAIGLSVKTVSTYRARLLEKLEMHSNAEVMR